MKSVSGVFGVLVLSSLTVLGVGCAKSDSSGTPTPPASHGEQGTSVDGSGTYAASCANPLSMSPQAGEIQLQLSDLVTGQPGRYVLVGTQLFISVSGLGVATTSYLSGVGDNVIISEPDITTDQSSPNQARVLCHTSPKVDPNAPGANVIHISGSTDFPYSISTVDGKASVFRDDSYSVEGGMITTQTTFHRKSQSIKDQHISSDTQVLVTRETNSDVVLKLQANRTNDQGYTIMVWVAATYRQLK